LEFPMTSSQRSIEVPGAGHNAPIPLGARVGPLLCSSGISGKDPANGKLPADASTQVRLAFANMDALLVAAGGTLKHVAKLLITISDNSVRDAINVEWLARFPDPRDRPARHIVQHDLQHGMVLQIEVTAFITPA
jgi:2-iminobutanoate/2-iminopropanoate deaminase